MFSVNNQEAIVKKGLTIDDVKKQVETFRKGNVYVELIGPAVINNGIKAFNEAEVSKYVNKYNNSIYDKEIVKFVPASGAASRMFKDLFVALEQMKNDDFNLSKEANQFLSFIKDFAFFQELKVMLSDEGVDIEKNVTKKTYRLILDCLLTEIGMNYGNLPKALIKFHKYEEDARTPIEEHLVEGANYSKDEKRNVKIHFTVSSEFKEEIISFIESVLEYYEDLLDVRYSIDYSEQMPKTDTIAVNDKNEPFLIENDELLFRPSGHGALIYNLNDIEADIVFIKNIDNVVPDYLKAKTYIYKQALAGYLIELQEKIYTYFNALQDENIKDETLDKIENFIQNTLCVVLPNDYKSRDKDSKVKVLLSKLDRPIRVCGMVKNEGEPGGGPFWVKNKDNSISLQIIEKIQVNNNDKKQLEILNGSTHFNPVDLVCSYVDSEGSLYDLLDYIDEDSVMISDKTHNGKKIKILERPGLWNGAMADWNTIFVEVPIETFNPVKTVNDLLRKEHQPK